MSSTPTKPRHHHLSHLLSHLLLLVILSTTPSSAAITTLESTLTVTIPASTAPLSPTYTSPPDLQASALNSTNFYRYEHNAKFLSWNASLAAYAQNWANKCVWEHSHGPYGENLARGYPSMTTAVDAWGNERTLYDFSAEDPTGFSEVTGHFTQLVWKGSTSTGCAAVECESLQGVLVVCEYYPPGNVVGDDNEWFKQNVQAQVNQGQGFNYAAATSGVVGPVVTTSALGTGLGTATATASQPGNTMGVAPGAVGGGGSGKAYWAFGTAVAALVIAGGMI